MGFAWVKLKSSKSKQNYIGQGYEGLEIFSTFIGQLLLFPGSPKIKINPDLLLACSLKVVQRPTPDWRI